jgi:hypothetical protein
MAAGEIPAQPLRGYVNHMPDRLKKIYFSFLAPAMGGFLVVYLFRQVHQPIGLPDQFMAVIAPTIFILAAVFAFAGPILYRSLFAHGHRRLVKVPQPVLYKFERNLTGMALVVPYLALVGYFLQLPRFHLAATLLMALYSAYYYYPSQKRIAFDGKIFRAGDVLSVERIRGKWKEDRG